MAIARMLNGIRFGELPATAIKHAKAILASSAGERGFRYQDRVTPE